MNDRARKTRPLKPLTLLQSVHQASRAIAAAQDEAAIGQALMTFASISGVHAARLLIFVEDEQGHPIALEACEGWTIDDRPTQPYGTRLPLKDYPLLELTSANELLVCENVETDERLTDVARQMMRLSGLGSFVVIPLTSTLTDKWIGAVLVGRNDPSTFEETFIYAWWTLAGQAAAALESLRLLQRLRQDRERYWDLYNNAPDCYFSVGPDGTLLEFNDTGLRWLGYTRDQVIGKMHATDILAPQSHPTFEALFPRLKAEGSLSDVEVEFRRSDGSTLPVLVQATAIYDGEGNYVRSHHTARDITARRAAEAALRESEAKHRLLLNSIPSPILALRPDMTILYCNQASAEMSGLTPEEMQDAHLPTLFPEILDSPLYAAYQQVLQTGESQSVEISRGERRIQVQVHPAPWGLLSVTQDITEAERAAAERERLLADLERRALQLQTAAEVSRAASSILDPQTLIQQTVDLIRERFDLYYTGLFLVDGTGEWTGEPGRWAVLRAGTGEAGRIQIEQGHKLLIGGNSMIGQCIATAQARIALDVGAEAVHFKNPYLPDTRSEMALPLVSRGQVIGAMTIQSAQEAAFTPEDIATLQTMADQLANAIENARLFESAQQAYREQQRRSAELALLNELSQTLTANLDVQQVLEEIYQGVSRLLDTTSFYIALYEADTETVSFPIAIEAGERVTWNSRRSGQGLTEAVIHSRAPVLIKENIAQWQEEHGVQAIGREALSWLGVPMIVGGQVIGVITVQSYTTPGLFDESARDLLMSIASQAAIAVQNARLFERTRQAFEEQQRRSHEIAVVNELGQTLTATLDVDQVLIETYRGVARLMEAKNFYIGLYDPDHHRVTFPINVSESEIDLSITEISADQGITGYIIRTGESVLAKEGMTPWLQEHGIEIVGEPAPSWMGVPLTISGQVIGVMAIQDYNIPGCYDEHDLELFTMIASQAAIAIQNARLYEQTQKTLAEAESLYRASAELNAAQSYDEVLETLRKHTLVGEADLNVSLNLFSQPWPTDEDGNPLPEATPEWSIVLARWTTLPPDATMPRYPLRAFPSAARLLSAAAPTLIADVETDPRLDDAARALYAQRYRSRSTIFVPLVVAGRWIGYINAIYSAPTQYDEKAVRRLMTLSVQAATAVQNLHQLAETEKRAALEQQLREITARLRTPPDIDGVLRVLTQELGQRLGRRTFVRLGTATPQETDRDNGGVQ